jgi:hypothetical protein
MRVGDCDRKGIGGIGAGDVNPGKQPRDHRVDLRLFRAAGANHRFLYQPRRIFADCEALPRRAHQRDAACVAEFQSRLRVFVDEHFLDRRGLRAMLGKQGFQLVRKRREPLRQRGFGIGFDVTVTDVAEAVASGFDQAPSGGAKAWIEADDQRQASFSSSSSETS